MKWRAQLLMQGLMSMAGRGGMHGGLKGNLTARRLARLLHLGERSERREEARYFPLDGLGCGWWSRADLVMLTGSIGHADMGHADLTFFAASSHLGD
jgi:hypothetical protein